METEKEVTMKSSDPHREVTMEISDPEREVTMQTSDAERELIMKSSDPERELIVKSLDPEREGKVQSSEGDGAVNMESSEAEREVALESFEADQEEKVQRLIQQEQTGLQAQLAAIKAQRLAFAAELEEMRQEREALRAERQRIQQEKKTLVVEREVIRIATQLANKDKVTPKVLKRASGCDEGVSVTSVGKGDGASYLPGSPALRMRSRSQSGTGESLKRAAKAESKRAETESSRLKQTRKASQTTGRNKPKHSEEGQGQGQMVTRQKHKRASTAEVGKTQENRVFGAKRRRTAGTVRRAKPKGGVEDDCLIDGGEPFPAESETDGLESSTVSLTGSKSPASTTGASKSIDTKATNRTEGALKVQTPQLLDPSSVVGTATPGTAGRTNQVRKRVPMVCKVCLKAFNWTSQYLKHLKSHTEQKTHQCTECSAVFARPNHLAAHMRRHRGPSRDHVCTQCQTTFSSRSSLRQHTALVHAKPKRRIKEFSCSECREVFPKAKSLAIHMGVHSEGKPFKCPHCKASFTAQASLTVHLRKHLGDKPFRCKDCDAAFPCSADLRSHARRHSGVKPYVCTICSAAFCRPGDLKPHMRTHTGEKPFQCEVCGSAFSTSSNLAIHRRIHTGERPFQCEQCGAAFSQVGHLTRHRTKHASEHTFRCLSCPAAFGNAYHLKVHMQRHNQENTFKCSKCGAAFSRASILTEHLRIHTGEKPYKCNQCPAAFARSANLAAHRRKHTGERPYVCQYCKQAFTQSTSLNRHLKCKNPCAASHRKSRAENGAAEKQPESSGTSLLPAVSGVGKGLMAAGPATGTGEGGPRKLRVLKVLALAVRGKDSENEGKVCNKSLARYDLSHPYQCLAKSIVAHPKSDPSLPNPNLTKPHLSHLTSNRPPQSDLSSHSSSLAKSDISLYLSDTSCTSAMETRAEIVSTVESKFHTFNSGNIRVTALARENQSSSPIKKIGSIPLTSHLDVTSTFPALSQGQHQTSVHGLTSSGVSSEAVFTTTPYMGEAGQTVVPLPPITMVADFHRRGVSGSEWLAPVDSLGHMDSGFHPDLLSSPAPGPQVHQQ